MCSVSEIKAPSKGLLGKFKEQKGGWCDEYTGGKSLEMQAERGSRLRKTGLLRTVIDH